VNGAAAASAAAKPVSPQTADAAPPLPDTALAVLKQEVPPLPFAIASLGIGEFRGIVEVQIDENGNVTSARILEPVHAVYDPVLLRAARDWKYQAPTIKGKPVSSLKRVEIVLRP
jgi:TonB family protein